MGQRYYLPVILFLVILACGAEKERYAYAVHPTAASLDKGTLEQALADMKIPDRIFFQSVPEGFLPVLGSVSHHLLVAPLINRWFAELRRLRDVGTFIIISPRHYRQGREQVSFSSLPWQAGNGMVEADRELVGELRQALGLAEDREAMHLEHGIGDLLPYIKKYFPGARIVPIVQDELHAKAASTDILAASLYETLKKRKDVFILLSVDFSHHAGREVTEERDAKTAPFLAEPVPEKLRLVYSDNNQALRVLARLWQRLPLQTSFLCCHTSSLEYTGQTSEDITSYFFCFWGNVRTGQ
jgi:AmmeMemoRadiSam system protein B